MSGVFQNIENIDHPPPFIARRALGAGKEHTRWVERGWGVNILEDARHCSALYMRKYFVIKRIPTHGPRV